jgi:hypothetical protein
MHDEDVAHVRWFASRELRWWLFCSVLALLGPAGLAVIMVLEAKGNVVPSTFLWPALGVVVGIAIAVRSFLCWRRYQRDLRERTKRFWFTNACKLRRIERFGQQGTIIKRLEIDIDGDSFFVPPQLAQRLPLDKIQPGAWFRIEMSAHGRILLSLTPHR